MTGHLLVLPSDDPVAGAEISLKVPGPGPFRLLCGVLTLIASAAVANRLVRIRLAHQGVQVFQLDAGAVQVATETRTYNLIPGVSQVGGSATASPVIALPPDVYLTDLSTFTTNTLALDVGDNFSSLVLFVEDCGAQPS
ncbi:MAG: hypothetical protein AUI52_05440 [Acidobacteria bacterium 13_1_40CM_2_68_10]|nr:MAG: hypothetical protein AUI52_05440 [Acidobacteria bacterium 13_1_40CM_2_68_10]